MTLAWPVHATDPGPRGGPSGGGVPIAGLTAGQLTFFDAGKEQFEEVEDVSDGIGPRMNLDNCGGCHRQPATGGTSPALNPEVGFATARGAVNIIPSFVTSDGPVREARFVRHADGTPDGGVQDLFTISGRDDTSGCHLAQPDFARAVASHNVIFRIPTPVFGSGLIEAIDDNTIAAWVQQDAARKRAYGVRGHVNRITGAANRSGNDGTVARFGWKAQNKSLLIFSGEAYNVEMGVSNDNFPNEREVASVCDGLPAVPNNHVNMDETEPTAVMSDMELFAIFMRFLAAPTPAPSTTETMRGKALFTTVGCAMCHRPSMTTGTSSVAALAHQPVNLYSDLLVHEMGTGLADGVSQGNAAGGEFRTAPLWGIGQRLFFLHDGRARDLWTAILAHAGENSEANAVISQFKALTVADQRAMLAFLRSL
jgi:CxxC motif-containing protein (DUF1111 family)